MAAEKNTMTVPLVVASVMFLMLWFVLSMSFLGSLVAAAAAGGIAHFAFGNKTDEGDDNLAVTDAAQEPETESEDPAGESDAGSTPPAGEEEASPKAK